MASITQYQIVIGTSLSDLGTKVNTLIGQGWQPLGSIAFEQLTGTPAQAMAQSS